MKKVTTKIIHIPYIEFTESDCNYINIAPITITKDTTIEYLTDLEYNRIFVYVSPFGFGHNSSTACYCYFPSITSKSSGSDEQFRFISKISNQIRKGGEYVTSKKYDNIFQQYKVRLGASKLSGNETIRVNDKERVKYSTDSYNTFLTDDFTFDLFGLGYSINRCSMIRHKLHYFRIERKNSLYKHYLPCVRIYNLVDDDNTIIRENLLDWGFFESVNQDYYIAEPSTRPAYSGDSYNVNCTNLLDINGNIIEYNGVGRIIDSVNYPNRLKKVNYINSNAVDGVGRAYTMTNVEYTYGNVVQVRFKQFNNGSNFPSQCIILAGDYQAKKKGFWIGHGYTVDYLSVNNNGQDGGNYYENVNNYTLQNKIVDVTVIDAAIYHDRNILYVSGLTKGETGYKYGIFNSDDVYQENRTSDANIYSLSIRDSQNVPLFQGIPVYDIENEEYGFYDYISDSFLTSVTDYPFLGG